MAHRIIIQVAVTGARVLTRAFTEAYKQASAGQQYAKHAKSAGGSAGNDLTSKGLTVDEACKILNVAPPRQGQVDMENVIGRFKRMFDQNDPNKGGSFYLQSKILRARQRLEMEVRQAEESAQVERELKEGFNPRLFKNR